ncbi:MAG: biopolymer transporter ExbD [Candidatus Krumholzibacteriia bacterium]
MNFLTRRRKRGLIINVTSLIDVMFLLLIFFMVTSTFKNQPAIQLVLPRSATAEEALVGPTVLYLTADGALFLNDQPVDRAVLRERLRGLKATDTEDRIVLRADQDSNHGEVVGLIDLIKETGFTRVSLSARRPGRP